jgi:outer membrane protein assembly factor BamB
VVRGALSLLILLSLGPACGAGPPSHGDAGSEDASPLAASAFEVARDPDGPAGDAAASPAEDRPSPAEDGDLRGDDTSLTLDVNAEDTAAALPEVSAWDAEDPADALASADQRAAADAVADAGPCRPFCEGRRCGDDGCGGACGTCAAGDACHLALRVCQPLAATAGACGDVRGLQPSAPWPTHLGCNTRNGRSPAHGPATAQRKWSVQLGGRVSASAAVAADGTIYVGSSRTQSEPEAGKLSAISPAGQIRWQFAASGFRQTPVIGADGTVYANDLERVLYAIAPDGRKRWSRAFERTVSAPTVAGDGTLLVLAPASGESKGRLVALDPLTGATRWTRPLQRDQSSYHYLRFNEPQRDAGPVTIAPDGTIYVAAFGSLEGLSPDGGAVFYAEAPMSAVAPMVGEDGTVYVVGGDQDGDRGVTAFRPDGARKWRAILPKAASMPTPVLGRDGSVLVTAWLDYDLEADDLFALDPGDGHVRWSANLNGHRFASPVVDAGGAVYVSSVGGVSAFEGDGRQRWGAQAESVPLHASATLAGDGSIYIPSYGGLTALGP